MLRQSFATFTAREIPVVMLNVDSQNTTGAARLYERVGMRVVRGWDVCEKAVASESPPQGSWRTELLTLRSEHHAERGWPGGRFVTG